MASQNPGPQDATALWVEVARDPSRMRARQDRRSARRKSKTARTRNARKDVAFPMSGNRVNSASSQGESRVTSCAAIPGGRKPYNLNLSARCQA
jgi:hypothetical protein